MEKQWQLLEADDQKAAALQQRLGIHPLLCRILLLRGIESFEAAHHYFRPQLSDLHDPFLMKDMDRAVARILSARDLGEKVLVFGDYDVDGTTSVALLMQFLQKFYPPGLLDFYIPHRYREGYGLSQAGIDFAHREGFGLIVTVDCGIKSVDLIQYGRSLGLEFIICDHHLPEDQLPAAYAILNPKQRDCRYPYKELCGCGIALKLASALARELRMEDESFLAHLDLVATAIAADIVPLNGENRILATFGLKKINADPHPGLQALVELSGSRGPVQLGSLLFSIAPRINAAGRMDDARKAVLLLLSKTREEARDYAWMLHSDNQERREADESITQQALQLLAADPQVNARKSTVVYEPHWHKGVVGIVASRLIERYYRPTVVLTRSGEVVAGSARSVAGFNLYEAVHACREHLLGYGGHFAAAGLTLLPEQVEPFRIRFEQVVASRITADQLVPRLQIDCELQLEDLTASFYRILEQMEPFGPENLRPVFIARGLQDTGSSRVVKEDHVKFSLRKKGAFVQGIGFHLAEKFRNLPPSSLLDVVFTVDENEWNGKKSLQLKVMDFRQSAG